IEKAPIPSLNVHRIPTEIKPPEKAAQAYEIQLREYFSTTTSYTFDLILLGIGEDGHTASLFPKSPILQENKRWVVAVSAPPLILPNTRITLTLPIINKAKSIFFLVAGSKKIGVVKSILNDYKKAAKYYPAAMVQPKHRLIWFIAN
ncbi:MAG: 6-phosphogluconolactonase, partial [Candidatus Heimdallarchaeota archaeon]